MVEQQQNMPNVFGNEMSISSKLIKQSKRVHRTQKVLLQGNGFKVDADFMHTQIYTSEYTMRNDGIDE